MATFQEFQTITSNWETIDKELKTLQPYDQERIRACLSILDDVDPIVRDISMRNVQAGTDLGRANADRRKRLDDLVDSYVQQTAESVREELRDIDSELSQLTMQDTMTQLNRVVEHIDRVHPSLNDVGMHSASAAETLGEHFVHLLRQVRFLSLRPFEEVQFSSDKIDSSDVEHLTDLLKQFDAVFEEIGQTHTSQTQPEVNNRVVQAMELLNDIGEKVNKVGEIDPELFNVLFTVHNERKEKLLLSNLIQLIMDVHDLYINFDKLYPFLSDVKSFNKAMEYLNESSPKINTIGSFNPLKGNELARSYNLRMEALNILAKKLGIVTN